MADDIDHANDLVIDLIENEVSRALSKIRESTTQNLKGAKICVECGDAIPPERKKLGYKFCVRCAEEMERKNRLYAS